MVITTVAPCQTSLDTLLLNVADEVTSEIRLPNSSAVEAPSGSGVPAGIDVGRPSITTWVALAGFTITFTGRGDV